MKFAAQLQKQIKNKQPEVVFNLKFYSLGISKLTSEMVDELTKFKNLETLCLNSCGIRSIENFPNLDSLKILELIDNFITSNGIKFIIKKFPNLEELQIGGNYLQKLEDLDPLKELKNLKILNFEVTNIPEKIEKMTQYAFEKIPSLQICNERDQSGNQKATNSKSVKDDGDFDEEQQEESSSDEGELEDDDNFVEESDDSEEEEGEGEGEREIEQEDVGDKIVKKQKENEN